MTQTSLITTMANKYSMDPVMFARTLRSTVMPSKHTDEQFAAFLMVADRYGLNPITREIYAFPNRKGDGITPVLSIDGWINLVNSHEQCDGFDFAYIRDDAGKLAGVTCTIHRKDRSHPTVVTEFLSECYRNTEPWNQWPARMLRHKAFKEAARLAFGFAGIADEDEARDIARQPAAGQSNEPVNTADDDVVMKALGQFVREPSTPLAGATDDSGGAALPAASADAPPEASADLRGEAIDKLLALAADRDLSEQERLEEIDNKYPMWRDQLGGDSAPIFIDALFNTAAKVAKGELKPAAAKKYLEGLK